MPSREVVYVQAKIYIPADNYLGDSNKLQFKHDLPVSKTALTITMRATISSQSITVTTNLFDHAILSFKMVNNHI
jgi:hypothetical protein